MRPENGANGAQTFNAAEAQAAFTQGIQKPGSTAEGLPGGLAVVLDAENNPQAVMSQEAVVQKGGEFTPAAATAAFGAEGGNPLQPGERVVLVDMEQPGVGGEIFNASQVTQAA